MKTKRFLSVALTLVMLIGLVPGIGLTASAAGDTTSITSPASSGTMTITLKIKADQTAPVAPTAASVTINSITLNTITNGEYKMGDGEWQDSPAFTGLTMNTEYIFYQRLKSDEDHNASPASPAANIKTSNHVHSWTYAASGATITATCTNTDGGHSGSTTATMTVVKPALTTYGGSESAEATITGSIDGVTTPAIVYMKGADTLTSAPTDAGTYTANITLGDATASVEYTISKANPTYTAPTGLTATYGDTLSAVTLPTGWTWANSSASVGNAGTNTFKATFTPTDTANYNTVENIDVTVTVGKADPTCTVPAGLTATYGDTLSSVTLPTGWAWADSSTSVGNAGSNSFPATFTPGDTANYNTVSLNLPVTVGKATGTAGDGQKPTANTLTYTGEEQALVTAPTALPDGYTKVQYSVDNGTTWTDAVPTGKEAGDHTVSVKYVGDDNHADFEGETITVTIKAVYTVKFNMNGADAIDDQSVVDGEKAAKPADPTRDGYTFDGWYQDATFAKAFDFDTPITANVTVYAKWTAIGYTMTSITGTTADTSDSWTKGTTTEVVITIKPDEGEDHSFAHFTGVQIDGRTLKRDTDYTAREGSTIVTLKPAMLQELSVGAHTVTINFDNGSVETRLTIQAAPGASNSPKTGDTSLTALWAVLMAVSGIAFGGMILADNKRRKARTH